MKLILGLLMVSNVNAFAMTEKNPERVDISIITLVDHFCAQSGYFNPAACVDKVDTCYRRAQWPKTVSVEMKIDVVNRCFSKIQR